MASMGAFSGEAERSMDGYYADPRKPFPIVPRAGFEKALNQNELN